MQGERSLLRVINRRYDLLAHRAKAGKDATENAQRVFLAKHFGSSKIQLAAIAFASVLRRFRTFGMWIALFVGSFIGAHLRFIASSFIHPYPPLTAHPLLSHTLQLHLHEQIRNFIGLNA